jgi:hypothetical protein
MVLQFPDLAALRLALTSGAVPTAVSLAPAQAGLDEHGRVWVESAVELPRSAWSELQPVGVRTASQADIPLTLAVCCWPQLLPLHRDPEATRTEQTPVLFELPAGESLPEVVTELLRLGNDRQAFRWLQEADGSGRALLRVVGPPYYTLLRALDLGGKDLAPVAYLERAPRVWVEIGYNHPLAEQIVPPAGQVLFLRPPRQWTFQEDHPFRDIYEILEFRLPDAVVHSPDADFSRRLPVSLRLARGGPVQPAELWVIREDALDQLDTLVRSSPDQLLTQLAFAVTESAGQPQVILRARPSKRPPPVLVLQAEGFRSYLRLANLFLPCGTRLHPPLRRDVVRRLLADDPERLVWLSSHANGTFIPESVPDDAFRPLADWVDYVLDHDHQALDAWVRATRFDFERFVCKDELPDEPKKKVRERATGKPEDGNDLLAQRDPKDDAKPPAAARKGAKRTPENLAPEGAEERPHAEPPVLEQQLRTLEERFLALDGPEGDSWRRQLWPELAILNAQLNYVGDAAVCWANALWEGQPAPGWAWGWLRAEAKDVDPEQTAPILDRLLSEPEPSPGDVRTLAAWLTWSTAAGQRQAIGERLGTIQHYLEAHEGQLPVRALWLAWCSLVDLSGGDVLALARARDRVLERLYQEGLRPDLDLPSFLRFAGPGGNSRARALRDRVLRLRELVRRWIGRNTIVEALDAEPHFTGAYADLAFAFGLASLGEPTACRELLEQAREVLAPQDDVHSFLLQAYDYRIQQALAGKSHTGPLPPEQLEYLEHMDTLVRYKIDRLRCHSRILEPEEKVDPFRGAVRGRVYLAMGDRLGQTLAALPDLRDRAELARQLGQLLWQPDPRGVHKVADRARILAVALDLAPRLGEAFALEVLAQVPLVLDDLPGALAHVSALERVLGQAALLERALFLAAHFGQAEHVQVLVGRMEELLSPRHAEGTANALLALDALAGQCFHGLRKLGMRDAIDRLLKSIVEVVLEGQSFADLQEQMRGGGPRAVGWPARLRALLHVAAGWFYFGKNAQADVLVGEVGSVLQEKQLNPQEQTKLACTYVTTLGQAPVEQGLRRLEELFTRLEGVRYTLTSNSHYVQSLLMVTEAAVLAVAREEFTLGPGVRRWLDEDEYQVRRRIHADVRALLTRAGLNDR